VAAVGDRPEHASARWWWPWPAPRRARRALAELAVARAGLLDGLTGSARRRRAALLAALFDDGMSLTEMRRAVDDAQLTAIALRRAVQPSHPRLTLEEVADRAGLEPDQVARWYRAFERPVTDDPAHRIYTDDDLDVARRLRDYQRLGLTERDVLPVARAVGRGVTSMADAIAAILGARLFASETPDLGEVLDYAVEIRRIARRDALHLSHLLAQSLAERIGSQVVAAGERAPGTLPGVRTVAVGFADITGFTDLGEHVSALELGELADLLAATAQDVIVSPVRLSKTIGDAVILVSPDPAALVHAGLELSRRWHRPDPARPPLRTGLAWGAALPHAGDWFGAPVNLASRITAVAPPGSVVADAELKQACGDASGIRWGPARTRRLKGVPERRALYSAQPAADPDSDAAADAGHR
jgi:adenylate cyclase